MMTRTTRRHAAEIPASSEPAALSAPVPVVLPHVVITVTAAGTMSIAVDGQPHLPEPFAPPWRREDFASILDHLTEKLRSPVRVEVVEADGTSFTDIITPSRRRRPDPQPAPEPSPVSAGPAGVPAFVVLHDELTSRGLLSLPTPKHPSKPLAVSSVHRLLTNPYYKGDVIYRGVVYKGAHEPLVPAEVWYQVQSVLTAHKSAAEATQVHDHYLKGTIYCGACGSRLIVNNVKNNQGNVYPYFVCSGRHSKRTDCTRQAILIEDVEHLIEDYYQHVQIAPARREALAGMLHHEFDRLMSAEADELGQLTANRDRLEHEQDRLMQAHYADAIPLAVLKREQDRISGELDLVNRRLDAHHGEYTDARAHLDDALNLLTHCADIYARCDDANRRLCNQAFFTKVYVDENDELRIENARPFEMLLDPAVNADALTWAADAHKARTPALDSSGQSSSLVHWVPPAGFEPALERV
ncbi:Recombinase [Propionibacterium freudenreichii subsp. freudenreichii]|uniref:Recombinase n=3 Tax=Propionibacterium freudenreichii TaxID=1744 RepID=A0A0B7NTN0_PROFF|nr:Recombinase [Propionibacterium freudenreichii subsp. freudenreichii]SBN42960.1 Recombinase [Propionibacterium freudenreichii]